MPIPLADIRLLCIFVLLALASPSLAIETPDQRVIVIGQVRSLTEVPYTSGLTASKAILAAGGFSGSSQTPVYLVRRGQMTKLDIREIIEIGRRSEKDPLLEPWDIIVVGDSIRKHP